MIGSLSSEASSELGVREMEISKIQRALETEIVKEKLKAYGLTSEEINAKLHDLDDAQVQLLAQVSRIAINVPRPSSAPARILSEAIASNATSSFSLRLQRYDKIRPPSVNRLLWLL
jgi:hypothetical protein